MQIKCISDSTPKKEKENCSTAHYQAFMNHDRVHPEGTTMPFI